MYCITVQRVIRHCFSPSTKLLRHFVKRALEARAHKAEITIRIVGSAEMTELNRHYRQKNGPTDVLSFPLNIEGTGQEWPLLGDIVVCADRVNEEAQQKQKPLLDHWAHIIVHGVCHLLGYDHQLVEEREMMQKLEIEILRLLGFANPYLTHRSL